MTEQEQELDESALFDETVADEAVEQTGERDTVEGEEQEQARDEQGRFASKQLDQADTDAVVADTAATEKESAGIRQLREAFERSERRRAELEQQLIARNQPANLAAQPAKQETAETEPDPLLDPRGYAKHVREQLREEMLAERREDSLRSAHGKYGNEFEEAYKAAQDRIDPALKAKMQASRDPGETLIQWHREQKVMREVGNDPNAWLEKKLQERLKDPEFLAKAVELARGSAPPQSNGRPNVNLPPSLNGASRSNAALRSDSDVSDEQLFRELAG